MPEIKVNGMWVEINGVHIKFASDELAQEFVIEFMLKWLQR